MDDALKRIVICFPKSENISGKMTLSFAKALVQKELPDISQMVSIIVFDDNDNNNKISCLERKNGKWKEKKIRELTFA